MKYYIKQILAIVFILFVILFSYSIYRNLDYKNKIAIINSNVKNVFDSNYVDGLKKQLEEISVNITNIENDKKVLENDLLHYKYLQECFSNKSDGFKKYFIGNMIEMFNERINQYLPFFFSEKVNITFDKDLYETIKVDDFESSFEAFSQGQRQRAELAINFALFDIARVFFSSDNKLLILDEVDKGLDLFGIKAMLSLLKAFDKQLKIFIVSHNPLLTDEIENKIKIVKDSNGFSVIE
jgi:DNA repair exonuclease SbcCD ATPase subunit